MHGELDWTDLRYFLAVARTGRFAAAARELGLVHTTVAHRVQRLEVALGAPLFTHRRGIPPDLRGRAPATACLGDGTRNVRPLSDVFAVGQRVRSEIHAAKSNAIRVAERWLKLRHRATVGGGFLSPAPCYARRAMRASSALPIAVLCITGCGASVRSMDVSNVPTFTLASWNSAPKETISSLMTTAPKAMVIVMKKGDRVPIKMRAAVGPVSLEPGENYLVFSRDTWMYIGPSGMLLSPDGRQWAPVQSGSALGKLYGLKQGTFQFGFGRTNGEPAAFTVVVTRQ